MLDERNDQGAPPAEYVRAVAESAKTRYAGRNTLIERIRQHVDNTWKPNIPKAYEKTARVFASPAVGDLHRRGRAVMAAQMPVPQVPPLKQTQEGKENASLREECLMAFYAQLLAPLYGRYMDSLMMGQGVLKVLLQQHRWGNVRRNKGEDAEDFNARVQEFHRYNLPFMAEVVPPETFYVVHEDDEGIAETVEITKRAVRPLARQFNLGVGHDGRPVPLADMGAIDLGKVGADATWDFIEYHNRDWVVYMVEGLVVRAVQHRYGRPPYFIAMLSANSSGRPEDDCRPVSFYLLPVAESLSQLTTIRLNWAYLAGFPTPHFRPVNPEEAADAGTAGTFTFEPGKGIIPPAGYEIAFLNLPPVGSDLAAMQEFFRVSADQLSLAPVLAGMSPGADVSNAATLTMIAAAKSIFEDGRKSVIRAFNDLAGFLQWLIEKRLRQPVPLWRQQDSSWLELGPDDIKGYYRVEHTLEPTIPGEFYQNALFWEDAGAKDYVDDNHVREQGLGIHNPEKMDERVRIEQARNQPQHMMAVWKIIEQALGIPLQAQAAGQGTPALLPIGPGGPGATVVPGIQQGLGAGLGPQGENPMMAREPGQRPMPMPGVPNE